jgi:predicted phosphodiesterase
MSDRPKFLVVRRILTAVVLLSVALASFVPAAGDHFVVIHGPYLQNPSSTSMTIVWFTNKPAASWIEYGTGESRGTFPEFGSLINVAKSSLYGLIAANTTRHTVTIEGLKPGKAYPYRVIAREIVKFEPYEVIYGETVAGDIREFRTLDPKTASFQFDVFQDIHTDPLRLNALLQIPGGEKTELRFFNGDTVSDLSREASIFDGFVDIAVSRFASRSPFIYIRGNHDTRGLLARSLEDYFPPRDGRFYCSFDHGPVHFIVLDSGEDKPDDSPVYAGLADFDHYRLRETEWLKDEVRSDAFANAGYRIVLVHIPPFGTGFTAESLAKVWGPILNEAGIDIVISGHYHRLLKIPPAEGRNSFPVLCGPQNALIRADVRPDAIGLKVIDTQGTALDAMTLPARPRK